MPWIGRKKIALVPVYRPNFKSPPDVIPTDWPGQIMRRMFFDPDSNGVDQSLRAYIHNASSGLADFDAIVQPMVSFDGHNNGDVEPGDLDAMLGASLRAQGFDVAAMVMLGGAGAGSALIGGYWARFVMAENVGVWAMEFIHCLTGFDDLYVYAGTVGVPSGTNTYNGNIDAFDEMSASGGTHPSAYTKLGLNWLPPAAITNHLVDTARYDLHAVGLVQPPPTGRCTAVRVGTGVPYIMIEARKKVDQFDGRLPSEGVIVYRVQVPNALGHWVENTAAISILTLRPDHLGPAALPVGASYTDPGGLIVQVMAAIPGGFTVQVSNPSHPQTTVPDVVGWTMAKAIPILQKAQLQWQTSGAGNIFRMSPPPDTVVPVNSKISITLSKLPPQ